MDKKNEKVVTTIRMDKGLKDQIDHLAAVSDKSSNEIMIQAFLYAFDHLEFVPNEENL